MMVHDFFDSPVGPLMLAGEDGRLARLSFWSGDRRAPGERDQAALAGVATQLREYFAGTRREFDIPLALGGGAFEQRVWQALLEIPFGETVSYGAIARRIGAPLTASRAVGLANGRNPVAIIVPCHRVIGADGSLTGYGGGLHRKRMLLDLERGALALPV